MATHTYESILELMLERYRELTGLDADNASDVGIRMKVLARQVEELLGQVDELERQVFVQSSTGVHLEMHAETRGLVRKGALHAQGALVFYREAPAQNDIAIAAGVVCATRPDPQVQFETVEAGVLPAGTLSVAVAARAVAAGAGGNVAPGSVCLMVTPAPGISGVGNPAAFDGGVDREEDAALRGRLLRSFSNISNGTNCAFYYDLAMGHDGVASANILPRQRGRGTVDVVVACHNPAAEGELVPLLQADLNRRKEINVDVLVQAAARDVTDIEAEVAIGDGYDAPAVLTACRETVENFVRALAVGDPLLLARLSSALLAVDGVYNCRVLRPGADVLPLSSHLVQAGAVGVGRMAVG